MKTKKLLRSFFLISSFYLFISCQEDYYSEIDNTQRQVNQEKNLLEKAYQDGTTGKIANVKWYGQSVAVEKIEDQYIFEGDKV